MPEIYFVDYNSNKILPIISDFIIGRFCLAAKLSMCVDIVVHSLGVIGLIHIGSVRMEGGIGLKKKTQGDSVVNTRSGFLKLIKTWIST